MIVEIFAQAFGQKSDCSNRILRDRSMRVSSQLLEHVKQARIVALSKLRGISLLDDFIKRCFLISPLLKRQSLGRPAGTKLT